VIGNGNDDENEHRHVSFEVHDNGEEGGECELAVPE
jgi:hypothetical protein